MKTEYDDRVKEYIHLKNGKYLVNVKDHDGVDDNGVSKKVNSQPFQFGSLRLSHSKRLMNDVIMALDACKNNKIYYGDTDSIYIHKNDYKMLIEKGLVGKDLFQSKNDYGENAEIAFGLFFAPKLKYCIVSDENSILSQKTTFKGFNQNIKNITFKNFLGLEQGKTLRNISKLKWKRELAGIKIPHRKVGCENCDASKNCVGYVIQPEMNCFNCEVSKSCQDCLSKITRIAEYLVEINKLKRQPENEFGHMLRYCETVNNLVIDKPVQKPLKRCTKCKTEINTENYIKNKTICRACHNENMRKRKNTDF